jgi:hypothetical protein
MHKNSSNRLYLRDHKRRLNTFDQLETFYLLNPEAKEVLTPGIAFKCATAKVSPFWRHNRLNQTEFATFSMLPFLDFL